MPLFAWASAEKDISGFMVVDCLLPGQVRQLGSMRYIAARKAIKATTSECEIRGGEYVAYDRANMATALKVWLPLAKEGDQEAQNYVGEIYEKGQNAHPNYALAAFWYLKAAEQGYSRAAINLGQLFEQGLGVEKDPAMAAFWYQKASGIELIRFNIQPEKQPLTGKITVVEPPLSGSEQKFYVNWQGQALLLIGEVKSSLPLKMVKVNGQSAKLLGGSLFRVKIPAKQLSSSVMIKAYAANGEIARLAFDLRKGPGKKSASVTGQSSRARVNKGLLRHNINTGNGQYYALIIGNNRYQKISDLETAINDAKILNNVLRQDYGFNTRILINADRYTILSELNKLGKILKPQDKLLIYYAGHGELDEINKRGHWLPVDAEADSMANWIPNISITDMLNTMSPRQLIVIADSCYSGMMSRSVLGTIEQTLDDSQRAQLLQAMVNAKARIGFSSGGVTPVLDSLGGEHSIFAKSLIEKLKNNQGAISGFEIFEEVAQDVSTISQTIGFSQVPEYAPLKYAGHESGDFVFIKLKRK